MENLIPNIIDSHLNDAIKNNKLKLLDSISMNIVTSSSLELSGCVLVKKDLGKITYRGFDVIVDYNLNNNEIILNYKNKSFKSDESISVDMSLLDTRKHIHECLNNDLLLARKNGIEIFSFNKPIFEEIGDYLFKLICYEIEQKRVEDAEVYLLNLKETINRLKFNESQHSLAEELGID